jgi:hypothetical protein
MGTLREERKTSNRYAEIDRQNIVVDVNDGTNYNVAVVVERCDVWPEAKVVRNNPQRFWLTRCELKVAVVTGGTLWADEASEPLLLGTDKAVS